MGRQGWPPNKWLERTMLGVTSLAEGKRRAARPPLSHAVRWLSLWERWYGCSLGRAGPSLDRCYRG